MNQPYARRMPPRPRPARRLQDRRRQQPLATRLGRARLVYLLGRSGTPLTDWLPLGLAAMVVGLMLLGGTGSGPA